MRHLKLIVWVLLGFLLVSTDLEAQQDEVRYGNTPDTLFPYSRFRQAYKYHFVEPIEFHGPGRDKKAPTDN